MFRYVIWDFNGTLIDDVETAVLAVNDSFAKHGIRSTDRAEYRRNMDMPIWKYYAKHADLSVVPMSVFSAEYLQGYEKYFDRIKPSDGALAAVRELHAKGVRQCIISSFEQGRLRKMCDGFGFSVYMDGIFGASDARCLSKVERGVRWMREEQADPSEVLVVGDLPHDLEMAQGMGAFCLLYANGHQAEEILSRCGRVIHDLREVQEWVKA